MADVLNKGNLFPELLVKEMINQVKGKSSLAALSQQEAIPFNGLKEFTFNFDKEVDIVAESGAKTKGGVTATPVTIIPVKVEYGARVSDEFMYAADEVQMDYLKQFAEGFAKKVARGLDIMAFHGVNPRTGLASAVIGTNHFDSKVDQLVTINTATADEDIESAIALIHANDAEVTGMVMAPAFRSSLAALKNTNGGKLYPELAWGSAPSVINGLQTEVNSTVSANASKDRAIIGDYQGSFKWGYAKEIPLEVIQYGNPDNDATLGDLKGHNQVYLRAEAYIGWGILDGNSFARIVNPEAVTFTAVQVGGTTGTANTTSISFTFSKDISGLSAANITLTDGTGKATKGVLTGSGKNYSLTVTAVEEGNIAVKVADIGGYTFPTTAATVAVYAEA